MPTTKRSFERTPYLKFLFAPNNFCVKQHANYTTTLLKPLLLHFRNSKKKIVCFRILDLNEQCSNTFLSALYTFWIVLIVPFFFSFVHAPECAYCISYLSCNSNFFTFTLRWLRTVHKDKA